MYYRNEHLIATFVPPTVIVDRQGDIIHVHGKTGRYLELPPGQPSNNLIQMARDGLQLDLAAALRHASASDEPIVHNHIMVKSNSDVTEVDISVRRITEPEAIRGLILVTFLAACPKEENHSSNGSDIQQQQGRFEKLELELQFMKRTLQNAIQQSDTTNEELKSTNEELQSINEELQSANEELETSKEEMQSLNEELQTVNSELSTKLEELSHSNDDMQNLLNSTEIATLFLDNDTKIKRYAKSATKVFKVRDVDVGRPLSEIVHNLDYNDLADDAKRVLDTLVFVEKEIHTRDGNHSYRVRILPYRTFENMIDGVVITLVDIKDIQEARDYAESIIATISEPFLVLNEELRIVSSNSAFYHYFQLVPEAIKDKLIGEIGTRQWNNNKLRRLLNSIVHENSSFNDFEITSAFQQNGHSKIFLSGHLLMQRPDQPRLVLLTFSEQPMKSDQTAVPIEG